MTDIADRTKLALRAAQMYYVRDLKMEAIADSLHVSRSSVSRLLSYARHTGLVDIRIKSLSDGISRLQHLIRVNHSVAAYVIPVPAAASAHECAERTARHAGRIVPGFIDASNVVGVAWGTTMSAVSRHLVQRALPDVTVVQLNGAAYTDGFGIGYVGDILDRFATAFTAKVEPLPVPAFFDDPETRRAMWRERSIARIRDYHARMDVAVFGVGDPQSAVPGHVYRNGYLDETDRRSIKHDGVVGDVATVFLRADGSSDSIALNERSSGPDIDVLRRTPRKVCVVSDPSRIGALRGALAAGLVTDLIIDERSANELVGTYVQGV